MLTDVSFLAAFLVGLLGGVHCAGMCGGIVGAISMTLPQNASRLPILISYNLGRISSYVIAGALMGGVGAMAAHWSGLREAQLVLQIIAGLFMVILGLYLGQWWTGLTRLEQLGKHTWNLIEPLGRRFMPVTKVADGFAAGLVWGWLPCGLVYSVLIWSLSSGSAQQGALLMLGFGLGTLPNLLLFGLMAGHLVRWLQHRATRAIAGGLVVLFGLYTLYWPIKNSLA